MRWPWHHPPPHTQGRRGGWQMQGGLVVRWWFVGAARGALPGGAERHGWKLIGDGQLPSRCAARLLAAGCCRQQHSTLRFIPAKKPQPPWHPGRRCTLYVNWARGPAAACTAIAAQVLRVYGLWVGLFEKVTVIPRAARVGDAGYFHLGAKALF